MLTTEGCGLDGNLVESSNFPLPNLQHKLRVLAEDLYNGKGFCVIRGIDYGRYCVEDATIIFLGIQSYIAPSRMRQDEAGNMIGKCTYYLYLNSDTYACASTRHL